VLGWQALRGVEGDYRCGAAQRRTAEGGKAHSRACHPREAAVAVQARSVPSLPTHTHTHILYIYIRPLLSSLRRVHKKKFSSSTSPSSHPPPHNRPLPHRRRINARVVLLRSSHADGFTALPPLANRHIAPVRCYIPTTLRLSALFCRRYSAHIMCSTQPEWRVPTGGEGPMCACGRATSRWQSSAGRPHGVRHVAALA